MRLRALQLVLAVSLMPVMVWGAGDARDDRATDHPEKTQRSTAAQAGVTVSLCVQSSSVTVHGWDKDEVMATSLEGAQIQFKRDAGADESKPAAKLEVYVVDNEDTRRGEFRCQAATDVQLRVPRGATVQIQTRDGSIEVTDVAIAYAGSQEGEVVLEKISVAAEVGTIGGSITIRDSIGRMDLNTVGGSVVAENVRPADSSESFEAGTVSGDIDLTEVSHSIMTLRTTTGDIMLSGPLAGGGKYGIGTMSGNVTLALPADSSFQLNAKLSSGGDIVTDFPLTVLSQSVSQGTPKANAKSPKASASAPAAVAGSATPQPNPRAPAAASAQTPPSRPAPPAPRGTPTNPPQPPATPQPENPVAVKVDPKVSVVVPKEAMVVKINPANQVIKINPMIVTGHTLRRVSAICGTGDATISVASFSGTLHLQKND